MDERISLPKQWSSWNVIGLLGTGSFAKVYLAEKKEYGERFLCAIKHISISNKKQENYELFSEGVAKNENDINEYYGQIKTDLIHEIKTNYELRGNSNIVCYSDHVVEEKKDGSGYDVYIMMEYLKSLSSVISERIVLNESDIIKIGIDLCSALEVLEAKNIIHRDIKPGNIFVNREGVYKLGDFGVAKVLDKTTYGMSIKGTVSYMAPEVFLSEKVDARSDIYSLGLVLYRLLNNNKPPFVDLHQNGITHDENSFSFHKRMGGERLPYPLNCSNNLLIEIIMKACEYRPSDRWQSASQMKEALLTLKKNQSNVHQGSKQGYCGNFELPPYQNYYNKNKIKSEPYEYSNNSNSNLKLILSGVAAICVVVIISAVLIMTIGTQHDSNNYIKDSSQQVIETNDTEKERDTTEDSTEKTVPTSEYKNSVTSPTSKPTEKSTEEKTEPTTEKETRYCYADVEYFLTVRKEADSTSEAIIFVPPLTSMIILDDEPVNGMLLVNVELPGVVGYVNEKYVCYSKESAKEETKNSTAYDFFHPKNKYIHIVKKSTSIYNGFWDVIDVLEEDELVYIVNIIDSNHVRVLFVDSELPYYYGIVDKQYLEQTDGC